MSLILVHKLRERDTTQAPLNANKKQVLQAQPGARYEVIDSATGKAPAKLVVKRVGQDLLVEVEGQPVLELQKYFGDTTPADPAFFDIQPAADAVQTANVTLTPASAPLGAIEDTFLLYPNGEEIAAWAAEGGFNPLWLAPLLLLAGAGGGGGGGGGDASPVPPAPSAPSAPATPSAPDMTAVTDSGVSDTDNNTNRKTPSFAISAPGAGQVPVLLIDGKEVPSTFDAATNTLTPNEPLADGPHTVATVLKDPSTGLQSLPSPTLDVVIDTAPPTVAITSDKAAVNSGEPATITFTFSEDPGANFDASDITVAGGTLGAITGTGLTRTATFTPTPGSTTPASVSVSNDKFTDAAGNTNADGADANNTVSMTVDTVLPTVAITSDKAALRAGETATFTFTFSEDPGASFDASDITVAGGTLGAITGTGLTRTVTFTPTPGSTTPASVSVSNGKFTDAAGNQNADGAEADNTVSLAIDTLFPTVAITSDKAALVAGETAAITFTFSEDPGASFDASDITVAGGTLGAITGTGLTRTATFTPTAGSTTPASVSVASGKFADAAGNTNDDGADANNTVSMTVDTALPTVAITTSDATLTMGETATITFTFSEDPGASFDASDIVVTGGTLGAITGTGLTRTAVFTPTEGASSADISVASATFTDAAGNANADGADANNKINLAMDTVLPTITITSDKAALKAGETATITFTFSDDPGTSFVAADITVAGGTLGAITGTGLTRTAVFTPTAGASSANISVASGTFTDAMGNTNADGADTNNTVSLTVDTVLPTVAITSDKTALVAGETATLTFTFSEDPGASFAAADIVVTGGTLGAITGTGLTRTAVFTPTAGASSADISVASATFTDAAGNANADGADANNTVSMTVDAVRPTVALTSDKAALVAGETATITFTFSEDPGASFAAADIVVTGGTLGPITGTGLTRTAVFTPTEGASSADISVASATFTDAAGNANADGADANNKINLAMDTVLPTITIASDKAALKAGETATITFTFSDDPGASFDASDITVTGGTLSAITGTGLTRTAVFTPTAGASSANISVASGTFTDAAGNTNADGADTNNKVTLSVDTVLPTVAITSDKAALVAGETAAITFTFSEDPGASFDASDITVAGGTLGAITGTGLTRTATFTPTAGSTAPASVSVSNGKFTDAVGNTNDDGADANNTVSMTVDTERPTVALTSDKAALVAGETATLTFTFSEDPGASFAAADITVAGGTLGAITGTGLTRTATFTPTPGSTTPASVSVSNGKFTDAVGNANADGADANNTVSMTVDAVRPTVAITSDKAALAAGETATLTFTFSEDPGASFAAADIVVTGGTLGPITGTGLTRTAVFTPTAGASSADISVASATFTDAAGNANADGADANNAVSLALDTVLPTVAITSNKAALVTGATATITFTFSDDPGASFDASDITVAGGTLGAITGTGLTRTATFTPTAGSTAPASVSVASGKFTDAVGNANADGADTNNTVSMTVDTERPTVALTSDKAALMAGETATITFTFSEDPGASFAAADITVAGGTLGAITGTGLTRTATFTPTAGSTTPASVSVASGKFTDAAGNGNADGADANNTVSMTVDAVLPTVAITSDKAALVAGETATLTFTFSEDPGASFAAADIVVTGGTLGPITGTGLTRTAVFTPTVGASSADISVASATFTDAAGNANADGADANNKVTLSMDTSLPTVALTTSDAALQMGETATITFTFSEDPGTSFAKADITVVGGTLGTLSGTGLTRTVTFTPDADSTTPASVSVASGKFTDAQGNANADGAETNNTVSMTVDTVPPTARITRATDDEGTVTGNIASGGQTDDSLLVLGGTISAALPPNAVVAIYDGTTKIGNAVMTGTTTWSFNTGNLAQGDHPLTARVEVGAISGPSSVVYDVKEQSLSDITTLNTATGTARPTMHSVRYIALLFNGDNDGTIDLSEIEIMSGGENVARGATVSFSGADNIINGNLTDSIISTGQKGYVVVDLGALYDVESVKLTNPQANLQVYASSVEFPGGGSNAATMRSLTSGDFVWVGTANPSGDDVTFTTPPNSPADPRPTLSGTLGTALEPGEQIGLYDGSTRIGTAVVNANGLSWTYAPTTDFTDGTHVLRAEVESASGTPVGVPSTSTTLFVSTALPAQTVRITGIADNRGDTRGSLALSGSETDDTQPQLTGTISAALGVGDQLVVYDGTTRLGFATVNGTSWNFTPPDLEAGQRNFTARVENVAGDGASSSTASVYIQSTTIHIVDNFGGYTGTDSFGPWQGQANNSRVTDDATPTVTGRLGATLVAGDKVSIYDNGVKIGEATVSGLTWSFTPATPLASGEHVLMAQIQRASGALVGIDPISYTIEIVSAALPTTTTTITAVDDNSAPATGVVPSGGITNDDTPLIRGTITAPLVRGESVAIYNGTTRIGFATVDGTSWSFTHTAAPGLQNYTARVESVAGNGPSSANYQVAIMFADTNGYNDNVGASQGFFGHDTMTDDRRPEFVATAPATLPAGYVVAFYDGTTRMGAATPSTGDRYVFTPTADMSPGSHTIRARLEDASGNIVSEENNTAFLITIADDAGSNPPTQTAQIVSATDNVGPNTGNVAAGGQTDDTTLALAGTLSAALTAGSGSTVRILDNGVLLGTAIVSGTNWTFNATLAAGQHNLTVQVVNTAGNGAASSGYAVKVQTMGAMTLTDDVGATTGTVSMNGATDDARPHVAGTFGTTLGGGEKLSIYDGSTKLGEATVSGTNWTFNLGTDLVIGSHSVRAQLEDASGNALPIAPTTQNFAVQKVTTMNADTITLSQADLSGLQSFAGTQALVDGQAGSDTMRLDTTGTLDLTARPATLLKGLEAIDLMAGNGKAMTLTLTARDLLDMVQGTDQWSSLGGIASGTGRAQLKIDGGSGDQLDLDLANWTDRGTMVSAGVTYHVYDSNALNAELLVVSTVAVI